MADYAKAWEKWFPIIEDGAGKLTARMLDSAGIGRGKQVLDIATGIGEPALTAAQRVGPAGYVLGIDLSPAMLEFAAERALDAELDNIEFRVMNANALELDDGSFDIALCRWGMMFVDDLQQTLRAVHAALKPGARIALGIWATADEVPALAIAARVLHRELGLAPPSEGAGTAFALADGPALIAVLESAGFEDISREPVSIQYRYVSAEEYLAHRRAVSTSLERALEGCSEDDIVRAGGVLDKELQAFRTANGGLFFDNRAYCVAATRV